ncbi:MAG TPA: hypothetical protein VF023_11245, partial [Bryobacteraceae bacterium]
MQQKIDIPPLYRERTADPYIGWKCMFTRMVAILTVSVGLLAQPLKTPRSSKLCIYNLKTKKVQTIYTAGGIFEAPNWSPDGKKILINRAGSLLQIPAEGGTPEPIDLQGLTRCNNDKGYSPDGKLIAFSSSGQAHGSQVYTVSASGG